MEKSAKNAAPKCSIRMQHQNTVSKQNSSYKRSAIQNYFLRLHPLVINGNGRGGVKFEDDVLQATRLTSVRSGQLTVATFGIFHAALRWTVSVQRSSRRRRSFESFVAFSFTKTIGAFTVVVVVVVAVFLVLLLSSLSNHIAMTLAESHRK